MLRSRICYGVLLLAAFGIYLFFTDSVSVVFLLIMLFLPIPLCIMTAISVFSVRLEFEFSSSYVCQGVKISRPMFIKNLSFLPITTMTVFLEAQNFFEKKALNQCYKFSLPSKASEKLIFDVESPHCGKVDINVKKIQCCDPLGLISFSKKINAVHTVYVLPEEEALDNFSCEGISNPDDTSSGYSKLKRGDDYSESFDYHQYHDGDMLKHIHWKLSGKQGEIIVREGSFPLSSKFCLLVEPNINATGNIAIVDKLLSLVLAVSLVLRADGIEHDIGVYSYDDECIRCVKILGEDDFSYAVSLLYKTPLSHKHRILDELVIAEPLEKYAKMIYFAASFSNSSVIEVESLVKNSGYDSLAVSARASAVQTQEETEAFSQLERAGIDILLIE